MLSNKITFEIEYDSRLNKITESKLFKIVTNKNRFFICNSKNKLTEIFPKNLDDEAKDFLNYIRPNYSSLIIDFQNRIMFVESNIIFSSNYLDELTIYTEHNINFYEYIKSYLEDDKAILLLNNIYDTKGDNLLIKSFADDANYLLTKKTDYDENGDSYDYFTIQNKQCHFLRNIDDYQVILLYGDIKITNIKNYISKQNKLILDSIKNDTKSYLNVWQKYNEAELESEYINFKDTGFIIYNYLTNDENGIKLFFDDYNFNKLYKMNDKFLNIGNKNIKDLFKTKNIEEYNKLEKDLLIENNMGLAEFVFEKINKTEKSLIIRLKDKSYFRYLPNNNGYICLSLIGSKISFKRRERAKKKIINGQAGMPNLHTWFTNNPKPCKSIPHVDIDYSYVSKKYLLTENQKQAIEIILNTPDIAIVQGPPGTGKTTVILEALKQLNSKKETKFSFGNNLMTGFRQETVNNLIKDVNIFGLPAVKISNKEEDNDNNYKISKIITHFTDELIDNLKSKYDGLSVEDDNYIEFKKKYIDYKLFDNTVGSSIEILKEIENLEIFKYDLDVKANIDKFIKDLTSNNLSLSNGQKLLVDFAYMLPLNIEAFKDNEQYIRIQIDILSIYDDIKDDVKNIARVVDNYNPIDMKKVRKNIILKYKEVPNIFIKNSKKISIINYLDILFEKIKLQRLKSLNGENIAILDFIDSLSENPKIIMQTMLNYEKVLAATNQYAISKTMADIKGNELEFDNVFIDEAATSSPLDLFIPMSIAKNKIILVGDHKQLPNITNDELIGKIKSDLNIDTDTINEIMKKTLFELLMERANELTKIDGIKRVITLNTQFRMHPELGNMISNYFYDGNIKSIRAASEFSHNYSNINSYLYWLNVPEKNDGNPYSYRKKNSYSRRNIYEAEVIANHIKNALENNTNLTIGVITLFKDQVEEINKCFKSCNLDNYDIKVGTVDTFQGREFDVVYLSMVYVFNEDKKFSRLAMKNSESLMCVALSRQKKLLIMVGDMNVYYNDLAKEKVNHIYNICNKCKECGWYE